MKRIGSVLLIMILVSGIFCGAAFADDKKGKEVTFLDIPWESSIEDTTALLEDKGVLTDPTTLGYEDYRIIEGPGNGLVLTPKSIANISNDYDRVLKDIILIREWGLNDDYKIGGYAISNMELLFMDDGSNTKLISVCINLETPSGYDTVKDVFPDIKQKLTTVYGKLKKMRFFGNVGCNYKGNNDTGLCLLSQSLIDNNIMLVYGRTDAVDLLKEAMKSVRDSNPDLSTTNTNGL